ncbi:MAG: ROK family protein, partial [Eggerthellaceae bacterium]|nr:ROK family protein [Eggerthellaceae bacterium]
AQTAAEKAYPDGKAVFDAALGGESIACQAVERFARHLALGLSQAACLFDPAGFVIGGGAAASSEAYLDAVRAFYEEYALPVCQGTPILVTELGNDCGIYGAAFHALTLLGR